MIAKLSKTKAFVFLLIQLPNLHKSIKPFVANVAIYVNV